MAVCNMTLDDTLGLLAELATRSLRLWPIPGTASARLINVSENATYLVAADDFSAVLRIHREDYHSEAAIESELAWMNALREDGCVDTPAAYAGLNGKLIQSGIVPGLPAPRFMVLFEFVKGVQPNESEDLADHFEELGEIAARTHLHSMRWQKPANFERLVWDESTFFGDRPTWGDWRDAPNVTPDIGATLTRVEELIRRRLNAFGKGPDRFGLIHADMRLANLLVDGNRTRLIDFDDCGMGWYLYDFASAVSFIEDNPLIPAMKAAWVRGYCRVRNLSTAEIAELDTFVMLRRMALLAWIGSHIEAPEPQALAPGFARTTADLGRKYLAAFS